MPSRQKDDNRGLINDSVSQSQERLKTREQRGCSTLAIASVMTPLAEVAQRGDVRLRVNVSRFFGGRSSEPKIPHRVRPVERALLRRPRLFARKKFVQDGPCWTELRSDGRLVTNRTLG